MSASRQTVAPCACVSGTLQVPGDKSISHRLAMLCSLADGESLVRGFLESEDCLNTLAAMAALGAGVERDGATVRIKGVGGRLAAPVGPIDLGNSGTGMRLLSGLVAGQPFTTELTGDASLRSRPMGRIREPLERFGASVELCGPGGCAPVRIRGGGLKGIRYELPVASAQVKSCVLLAGLQAAGTTEVIEPRPTRDHTELVLRAMGVDVQVRGAGIVLPQGGNRALAAGIWRVPGDFSSAAFWIVAAACLPGSEIEIREVGLNPRRTALLAILRRMGADIEESPRQGDACEPAGTVRVRGADLRGTSVGGNEIPNVIDELPLVAVAAALARGETEISDAAELRVKESDRITSMAAGLGALGVPVEERPDGMLVRGGAGIRGGVSVDSRGDHRVAMAMAVLALSGQAPVTITDVDCVATSYPGFWKDLAALRG